MHNVSAEVLVAMESSPYIARLTLDGTDIIKGNAVTNFSTQGGTNSTDEAITLGGTVSGSVIITLDKGYVDCTLEDREMFLELGIEMASGIEWIPMGTYKVTNVTEDDGNLILTASDSLSSEFDVEYEPIEGFDFSAQSGVDSILFLKALCGRRGVEVDATGLTSIPLKSSPEGYTERQIIGFISALHGGFAVIDRHGVLKIRWYSESGVTIDPDRYYAGGMEKASFDFTVGWIRCYVEPNAETLFLGDTTAPQGIYFECPWMTEDRLEEIWEQVKGFLYRPVPVLKFFGDPRLDPGDIIALQDLSGTVHSVPVMSIRCEYDGGVITRVAAKGKAKTDYYQGPVVRETKRLYSRIVKRQNAIELSISEIDGDKIIALINLSASEAHIKAPKIKLEGTVTANQNFKVLEDGSIEAVNATISGTFKAGTLNVNKVILSGVLKSADGKSYFDLDSGEFASITDDVKVIIKNGQIYMQDTAGINRVHVARFANDDYAIMLNNANGDIAGGMMVHGNDMFFGCLNVDDGTVNFQRIGRKTIDGVDYYVSY